MWAVMSFPILEDIYSEPIISEICNIYPVNKPTIKVPRIRIRSNLNYLPKFDTSLISDSL